MRETFQHSKPMFFSCVHYFSVAVNSRFINPPSSQSNLQVDNTLLQRRLGHDNFFLTISISFLCLCLFDEGNIFQAGSDLFFWGKENNSGGLFGS